MAKHPIEVYNHENTSLVDDYWGVRTVLDNEFSSAAESIDYLDYRCKIYPFFREFMNLWNCMPEDGTMVDYGCGPANDLVGFLQYSKAKKVIGIDVSPKALQLAVRRLELHDFDPERIRLIQTSDDATEIPLETSSVDYIYCEGVLHHTSQPETILKEFYRILKPNGHARIMIYNRNSIFFHLTIAYVTRILEGRYNNMPIEETFARSTDGENCPLSRCYIPSDFNEICRQAGFFPTYIGGYHAASEIYNMRKYLNQAINDDRLEIEHREFLQDLVIPSRDYPKYNGFDAGIGGSFHLAKDSTFDRASIPMGIYKKLS